MKKVLTGVVILGVSAVLGLVGALHWLDEAEAWGRE